MISTVLKKVTKNVTSTTLARYYSSSFLRSLISLGWSQLDYDKAELLKVGIFFTLNFLTWEFLLVKKLEIEKNKTIQCITFKTDIIKVVLVFSISNFFTRVPKK